MFCPKCKAEYREGFYKCADCKIDLVWELPPEPELPPESEQYVEYINLVNFETYSDRQEAEFAKGLLSANGIYAVVQGDKDPGYDAAFVSGVQLLVKKEDVWEAKKILSEINRPNNTLEPTPSKNTIKMIAIGVLCLLPLMLILILIGFIIKISLSF